MSLRNQPRPEDHVLHESPWTRWVSRPWKAMQREWFCLELCDFVAVLARDVDGYFQLVRQERPAVRCVTLEMVAGLVEEGESALETGRRELMEEAGFKGGEWTDLGTYHSDTGRLDNRIHFFYAKDLQRMDDFEPEKGLEVVSVPLDELDAMVLDGRVSNSMHVAIYLLARRRGLC